MKRQGRSWSGEGMEYMVWVLTARKNKTLTQALLYHANGKSYKKMDRAMHKAAAQAERRIAKNVRSEAQKRKMRNYRPGMPGRAYRCLWSFFFTNGETGQSYTEILIKPKPRR